jgi:PAS domain S-box-containing protein
VIGLVVLDGEGTIVAADDGAANLVGWTAAQLIGMPVSALVAEDDRAAHGEAIQRYLAAPVPRALGRPGRAARVLRRDGKIVEIAARLAPLGDGEVRIAVIAFAVEDDRTARERTEMHLAAAQRITHCGSWELDLTDLGDVNRNPLRWSDEVFRIFGHEPGAIEVTNENFFAAVHPEDRERIADAVRRAIETGTMYAIDHRVIRPDGSIRIVHEESEIQYDADGRPALMIGTVQDITERKLAEEALRRAEHAAVLSDRMASVGLVAAGVAHEINNPLAAVMMSLDLLASRVRAAGGTAEISADALDDARTGLDRVREIVRDLRVFARDDQDRRAPVDVVRVVGSTLRMASGQIAARARLVTRLDPVPPVTATDARLGQVVLNLLLNATQAIGDGDPEENEIEVTTAHVRDHVVVSIRDTGGGIPPELRTKIFTPFFTTKDVGVGTGLGLSICHRIITNLGGEIDFTTEVGVGTEFRVTLPVATGRASTPRSLAAAATAAIAGTGRRAKILVIDDEPGIGDHLADLLGTRHAVVAMRSAADALDAIVRGERYDVILCDLMMPQMTGMELHAELERVAPDQARRMIAMTGGAFSAKAREFLAAGHRSIDKPFDFAKLEAMIAELVTGG